MDVDRHTVCLEIELSEGDHVAGRAVRAGGQARSFAGWLGLLHALHTLIAEATSAPTIAPPDGGARPQEGLR